MSTLPTILFAGGTGNTGAPAVRELSKRLQDGQFRILVLTRSKDSAIAKELAQLPGVEVQEENWITVNGTWLRNNRVIKAFLCHHNSPSQFTDESLFLYNLLHAGVQYVVRISTTPSSISPDTHVWYGRSHWAVETLLSTPEFKKLSWTSLQPGNFHLGFLSDSIEFVKEFKKNGKQTGPLKVFADQETSDSPVDPNEVGIIAGILLAESDFSVHAGQRYAISGPENVNGNDVVKIVEKLIGEKVQEVQFRNIDFFEQMRASGKIAPYVYEFTKPVFEDSWNGKHTLEKVGSSEAILKLYKPKSTAEDVFTSALQ